MEIIRQLNAMTTREELHEIQKLANELAKRLIPTQSFADEFDLDKDRIRNEDTHVGTFTVESPEWGTVVLRVAPGIDVMEQLCPEGGEAIGDKLIMFNDYEWGQIADGLGKHDVVEVLRDNIDKAKLWPVAIGPDTHNLGNRKNLRNRQALPILRCLIAEFDTGKLDY
jgi:hypothetical protein